MQRIRIWVYDGILASSVAGVIDVFMAANAVWAERNGRGKAPPLQWRIESLDGKPVQTASGQLVSADAPINARAAADAIVVPGPFVVDLERFFARTDILKPLCAALRRQHERGTLLASYCTGSFILAEAGLLDGGVATTHWARAKIFAKRYPDIDLRVSEILTEQNNILCSAAVTTSLNLALRIVEKFVGRQIAEDIGRIMLIDSNRVPQSSYAIMPEEAGHSDALVARAQRFMEKSLRQGFNLAELARHLSVSERTLNRRFKLAVGVAPLQYLQTLRVDVAKRLLQQGRLTVDAVGERVGYRDLSTFRRLFRRQTGLSPRDYQRRFLHRTRLGGVSDAGRAAG
ncbi:GlxA family transcriptional regulator [Bradyrhizobium sp. STM 3557]|uniref:GlxA family transcriptional regulator n=1 Tax=Bradyrhizobium sp. STM 3557 TaxID=578920 RepID=UPI00388DFDF8